MIMDAGVHIWKPGAPAFGPNGLAECLNWPK